MTSRTEKVRHEFDDAVDALKRHLCAAIGQSFANAIGDDIARLADARARLAILEFDDQFESLGKFLSQPLPRIDSTDVK
jgi:hypothetical protein